MSIMFNRRAAISLAVLLFFSVIFITSILMFINPHTPLVATVHTGVGFILVGVVGWHIKNNFSSLKNYVRWHDSKTGRKINLALPAIILVGAVALGVCVG